MKKRYSEEQIIGAIKRREAGAKVSDLCRELGVSVGSFYNWRSKYGGPEGQRGEAAPGARIRELKAQAASGGKAA